MCGIAGLFAYHPDALKPDGSEVRRMTDHMVTRGPDGQGQWTSPSEGRVILGHRRLAILDRTEAGAQPMHSADGRLTITFDGEIYNYRHLRSEMEARGWQFRSTSAAELLLPLWDAYGADMVHHLRGMFAFALWDERQQNLYLARDPFGIKPLYYTDDGKSLRFASQVKALMAGGGIQTGPDLAAWAGYYLLGYVPEPHTIHQAIRALLPGQTIQIHNGGSPRASTYFHLTGELQAAEAAALDLDPLKAQTRLREVLADSVCAHMVSDVPAGLLLSTGLHSSTLAAIAAEASPSSLRAITIEFQEFKDSPNDESSLAALTARHLGVAHESHRITRDDFAAHLDQALVAMDQPSIDGINTYFVSMAAARAGMKVALSGLGGSSLLAGYPSFRQVPRMARLIAPLARISGLGIRLRQVLSPLLGGQLSPKFAGLLEYGGDIPGAYLLRRAIFMPWELPRLLGTRDAAQALEELGLMARLQSTIQGLCMDRSRLMALEMGWYMSGQLLKDTDWAAMAHGLEVRLPLVDRDLFRALAPLQLGPRPLDKANLHACPRSRLPQAIHLYRKTGCINPVQAWAHTLLAAPQEARGMRGWAKSVAAPMAPSPPRGRRILVLLTDAYGGHGGIAQYSRDLLAALCSHPEVREVVALPRIMPHRPGPLPAKLTWVTAGLGGKLRYLATVGLTVAKNPGFDLVLCGHLNLLPLAGGLAPWVRSPRACFIYGIDAWHPTPSPLVNALVRSFGPTISISAITLQRFQTWSGAPQHYAALLPNAIHLGDYSTGPKPGYLLDRYGLHGKQVLLTLGRMDRLERYKGFDEVLEILPTLRQRRPNVVYVLAGDGKDQGRLAEKARRLGVEKEVIFTGRVAEHEKGDHFRLADAYIMPSRGEGFGFVVLEALASGIPIVASSVDGTREAARDGLLGRLVDPDDPCSILEGVEAALDEGAGPVPERLSYFSFTAFTERTHHLIERLWSKEFL